VEGKVPQVTQEVTADLLAMQRQAVEASVDTADMDALSDEIFGQAVVEPPPAKKPNDQKLGEDVSNKTKRELEATQNLAVHLQTQIKELEDFKAKTEKEIAAYEKVAVALYEQVEAIAEEGEASRSVEAKMLTRKAVSTVRNLQKEAHDVIRSLETRLESAIRIGDSAMDNAITLRHIADQIYARTIKGLDEGETFKYSRSKILTATESRKGSLTELQVGPRNAQGCCVR
jgi:hypothetical protein